MGKFIYIMGKSASGKDTVGKNLKDKLNLKNYVMYTTRPIRDGEEEGVDYFYINEDKINEYRAEGKVIESRTYNTVHGPWTYATINDNQLESDQDILGIGTLESYKSVREFFLRNGKDDNLLPVYIEIDEAERRKRAEKRENMQKNPKFEEMERRLKADNIDFSEENLKLAGIKENQRFKNYDLEECVENIIKYIKERENKKCQEIEETKEVQR